MTAGSGIPVATDQRNINNALVHVQRVGELGASAVATNQVDCSTTAEEVVSARGTRNNLLLVNQGGVEVYIGGSAVTTSTGIKLGVGASLNIQTTAAIFGVTKMGSATIHYIEEYDV